MTMARLRTPLVFAVGLSLFSWGVSLLDPTISIAVRLLNGFIIIVLLGWVIRRILGYEARLTAHELDVLSVIATAEATRTQELTDLISRTATIAEALAVDTQDRATAVSAEISRAADALATSTAEHLREQTDTLTARIDLVSQHALSAFEEANNVNQKIAATNVALLGITEQIKVGSDHAEHAFTEANHVNLKIEDLNARLLKQGEKSDARLDSIKTTGEESHEILTDNLVQAKQQQAVDATSAAAVASTAADVATTAASVASKAAGIAAGQLDSIQKTGEATHEMVKGAQPATEKD